MMSIINKVLKIKQEESGSLLAPQIQSWYDLHICAPKVMIKVK